MSRKHSKEADVIAALKFPAGSAERKNVWHKLRSRGNYHHNMTVMDVGEGSLVVARKPNQSGRAIVADDFLPCRFCRGFYRRQELWKHTAACTENPHDSQSTTKFVQRNSKLMVLGALKSSNTSTMLNHVLATLRNDAIGIIARNDQLILGVGKFLVEKHGITKAQDSSQTMRELSRLVLQLRKENPDAELSDFITPKKFDTVVEAVKELCAFETEEGQQSVGTPSLALKIGYALKKCVEVVVGKAVREENEVKEKAANKFHQLLLNEWATQISHHSANTLNRRKFNKVNVLPLAEDLAKLRAYIDLKQSGSFRSLEKYGRLADWKLLAQTTLTRMFIFNKRRGGEVSRLPLQDYQTRPNWDSVNSAEIAKSLDKFERALSKK